MNSWRGLNRNIMIKKLKNTLLVIAFVPLLAMTSLELHTAPLDSINNNNIIDSKDIQKESVSNDIEKQRLEKALKIETYFQARSMPLAKYSMQFVLVAEKYGLPYEFLPAIAVRESSGGKRDMNNNPFGWGSARIKFSDYNEAIEVVGKNLGGANPRTAHYYGNKSVKKKLYYYNGTIIDGYEDQVIDIMSKIDNTKIDFDQNIENELAINK